MTTIDDVYLPFSSEELTEHFAPVQSGGDVGKHLSYYKASAERARAYAESPPIGSPADLAKALKAARQMEKDERFWVVAALMSAFHASHRVTTLTALLARCLGQTPPMAGLASWADALA